MLHRNNSPALALAVAAQIVTAEQESQARSSWQTESDDESDDAPDRSPAQSGFQPCKNETVALCAAVIRQANGHVAGDSLQRLMWVALELNAVRRCLSPGQEL